MAEYSHEKFYWFKLKEDFFKRHDIRILKQMPNGKDYLLFLLELMAESISHGGELRYSELIPYDEQMLSVITDTNIDTVRSAMKVLQAMGFIEIWDDRTIYVKAVEKLIGSQTHGSAKKMEQRKSNVPSLVQGVDICPPSVHPVSTFCPPEIDIEIEKEKDREVCAKSRKPRESFTPPTLEEVKAYVTDKGFHFDAERFYRYYADCEHPWTKADGKKVKDWKRCCQTWENTETKGKEVKHDFGEYEGSW